MSTLSSGLSRRGRISTSCLECRRLKRKCNRQWPCQHCQARKTAHLCQFVPLKPSSAHDPATNEPASGSTKRKFDSIRTPASTCTEEVNNEPHAGSASHGLADTGLEELGYLDKRLFEALNHPILEALRAVPPRPYTDSLIQCFFEKVNHHYGILHQPSFMPAYVKWWAERRLPQHQFATATITFTILVLRICANASQFVPGQLRTTLEAELGDSVESLSSRYQSSANILSSCNTPGEGGLMQVQQLFLGATWQKAEANFIESWHALAAAAREAQEIGLDRDDAAPDITNLEREMRRRLCFMSAIFHRPPIITQRPSPVPLPNPRLDQPSSNTNIPSPILAKVLENQIATSLSDTAQLDTPSRISLVESWMAALPAVFNSKIPDRRLEQDFPYIPFQRLQLRCVGYMSLLAILRSYFIPPLKFDSEDNSTASDERENYWLSYAINTAICLIATSKEFFDLCYPSSVKYFMVAFCPFDTAALLCSALRYYDTKSPVGSGIPRRREVLEAIGCAMFIAKRLVGLTKLGDATAGILAKLVARLDLSSGEMETLNYASRLNAFAGGVGGSIDQAPNNESNAIITNIDLAPGDIERGNEAYVFSNESLDVELGPLHGFWDWGELGFGSVTTESYNDLEKQR
ncbi:hypothetical protein DL765_009048 [Monosporascus sp. GIB2]|nr:hypothetical protein DL765_009048 [Monosporascus sp. GIB2]